MTWTNQPGTNAFILEWTPSLAGSWAYATPPLDLIISTNTRTTVPAPAPLTARCPEPLAPINGRPSLLTFLLRLPASLPPC